MKTSKINGKLTNLKELLTEYIVEIPIIQRDYAQGRNEDTVNEIRIKFLDSLYEAISAQPDESKESGLVLDFIYGSIRKVKVNEQGKDIFEPIDGQQRLTTLFLLHWYLAVKDNLKPEEYEYLKDFTYRTRESAGEFCLSLVSNPFDLNEVKDKISEKISEQSWYHNIFDDDPTVKAMLNMLDAINEKFNDTQSSYGNLTEKKAVSFWYLPLDEFGLTDDLFIKMNARGKKLTRFENFKAEIEQGTDTDEFKNDADLNKIRENWLDNIDNKWLDLFWQIDEDTAEYMMYCFILFLTRSLYAEKTGNFIEITDNKDAYNRNDIEIIKEKNNFILIADALGAFETYYKHPPIKDAIERIITIDTKLTYPERALVFGFILFGQKQPKVRTNGVFFDLINNLVCGQRYMRPEKKKFEGSLTMATYGRFLRNIRKFISIIPKDAKDEDILQSFIDSDIDLNAYQHTKEKAQHCLQDGVLDKKRYDELKKLEDMNCFNRQIHNILFNGKLFLSCEKMEKLLVMQNANPKLLLRCIQSMLNKQLLQFKYEGIKKWMYINKPDNTVLYFSLHKFFYGFNLSEWGDYIWSASVDDNLCFAVRAFIKEASALPFKNLEVELNEFLKEKIDNINDYNGIAPYMTKYSEFWSENEKSQAYLLERSVVRESIDWTRIYKNIEAGLWYGEHYNPFIMALNNLLTEKKSKVTIKNPSMCRQSDNAFLDEWVVLSNGRKLKLKVNVTGARFWELDDGTIWDCGNGNIDCIEFAAGEIFKM